MQNNTLDVSRSHIQPKKQGHKRAGERKRLDKIWKKGGASNISGSSKSRAWGLGTLCSLCGANQWTGFYMITASVMKWLNSLKITRLKIC